MYAYDFYPTHCGEGSCMGMTQEIIEQILKDVPNTYYYYIAGKNSQLFHQIFMTLKPKSVFYLKYTL